LTRLTANFITISRSALNFLACFMFWKLWQCWTRYSRC